MAGSEEKSSAPSTHIADPSIGSDAWRSRHPGHLLSLLGVCLCVLGSAALAGLFDPEFGLATEITPAGLLIASGVFVVALLRRVRLAPRLITGLALFLFGTVAWPETAALAVQTTTRSNDAKTLKVLTANVWSANSKHGLFLDYVRREQPHVIVVVEAYRYWMQAFEALQPEYRLAGGCALPHECDVVILTTLAPGKDQAPPQSARVLANLVLPEELGGGPFKVLGLHLSRPMPGSRTRPDLDEAIVAAKDLGSLGIAAGDFNATPWGADLRRFDTNVPIERRTRWLATWPATLPNWDLVGLVPIAPIDHIYAGDSWRVVDIERGPDVGSDHYPVLATFSLDHR